MSRRSWSQKEEEILLAAVKDLIVRGWKSDNGFRGGHLLHLEDAMKKEFPHTDIKGTPHIKSKLGSWKKNYGSLTGILSRSGIGWNLNGNFTIDYDDHQWDQIVKLDGNARTMRFKSWPHYDAWKEIFGMDRANGLSAEDILDAYNNFNREDSQPTEGGGGDYYVNMDEINQNEGNGDSFSQSHRTEPSPTENRKKRKVNNDFSEAAQSHKTEPSSTENRKKRKVNNDFTKAVQVLTEMSRATTDRLETLVSRIGVEFDVRKAKQEAYAKLGSIPSLSMEDKFNVCIIMAGKVELLEIFIGLPEEARPNYVAHLLKN